MAGEEGGDWEGGGLKGEEVEGGEGEWVDNKGVATARLWTGHYSITCTHEAWKEGDPWPPVQSDSEEEEGAE